VIASTTMPVVAVPMMVPVVMPMVMPVEVPAHTVARNDDYAATSRAPVRTAPIVGRVMPETRNAMHVLDGCKILHRALHACRSDGDRFGAISQRPGHQHRGDRRNAQEKPAHKFPPL
jgi:hypothetical protein